ncbi:MAG: PadR family transcriptional regulator [Actinomycetota bacterium]|nr:PadR family transcriptional regulator [Actinomycetota bacterium]
MIRCRVLAMAGIQISTPVLNVLLALADRERHGYGIMLEVANFTDGSVRLGPGTLYGAIKRMLGAGLVEECEGPDEPGDDERRRYYRLTGLGQETLATELAQAARTVAVGRDKHVGFPKTGKAEA